MHNLQKAKTIIGIFIAFIFCACFVDRSALAEGTSIAISPSMDHISLEPGQIYTGKVIVKNTSDVDYDFVMAVDPYHSNQNEDAPNLANYTQIADWITLSDYNGHLSAGEKKEIIYMVKTPADTPAGGQYAMITAGFETESVEGAINVSGAVGTIIYAQVAGETRESGSIQDISVTGFTFVPNITASAKLSNTGNIDADATLSLAIKSAISGQEVYSNVNNPSSYVILPDSTREVRIDWDGAPFIGAFNAAFTISYLDEVKTANKFIIICPAWVIFLVVALIVAIIVRIVGSTNRRAGRRGRSSKFSL